MKSGFWKTASVVAAWTLATVALRVFVLPQIGANVWRYLVMYAYLVGCVVFWFVRRQHHRRHYACPIEGERSAVVGWGTLLTGVAILLTQAADIVTFVRTGKMSLPTAETLPTMEAIGGLDPILFGATLVFGVAASACLIGLGMVWVRRPKEDPLIGRGFLMLIASLWLWARVGRYITAYAYATNFKDSFFEFFLLAVPLLWLYLLGKRAVESDDVSSATLYALTELTAMVEISGVLSRAGLLLLRTPETSAVISIVLPVDAVIGLMAWTLMWYWDAARHTSEP